METGPGGGNRRVPASDLFAATGVRGAAAGGDRGDPPRLGRLRLRAAARAGTRVDGTSVRDRDRRYHALSDRGSGPVAANAPRPGRRAPDCAGRTGRERI